MRAIAIVELPVDGDGVLRARLLRAAYFASRRGPVVILAPSDTRDMLDRELDPIVALDCRVRGVLYGEASDSWVWRAASSATLVVASSDCARGYALSAGARWVESTGGVAALQSMSAHVGESELESGAGHGIPAATPLGNSPAEQPTPHFR